MALIKCKECGHEVSNKAEVCPQCGAKVKRHIGCFGVVLIGFAVLVVWSLMFPGAPDKGMKTADIVAEESKMDVGATVVKMAAVGIKAKMHNPDSFELDYAGANSDVSVVCMKYRGTNLYNALVTSRLVILEDKTLNGVEAYAKHCDFAKMRDLTFVKRMLD